MKKKRWLHGGESIVYTRIINNLTGGQRFRLLEKKKRFRTVGRLSWRFICFLINTPGSDTRYDTEKEVRARSKNRQKAIAGVVWLNARPAYCQRGEHRAHGDRSKHPVRQPLKRRSGSKGLPWVGSSFVERVDEGSSFIFHPFLRPSEKRGGFCRLSRPSRVSRAKGRQRGAGEPTEGFIIVHDKSLKMNMREVK